MNNLDYVNIKQGTESSGEYSNGNTLPYTMLPFGMVSFSPQTNDGNWFYNPHCHRLYGIRLTHQPSPWIRDYGQLLFMPQTGGFNSDPTARAASYRINEAVLRPDYISVNFLRYGANFELTPTERGAMMRLRFDGRDTPRLSLFAFDYETEFHLDIERRELSGFTKAINNGGDGDKFKEYFVLRFDKAIDAENTQVQYLDRTETGTGVQGKNIGMSVAFFETEACAAFATSYISVEQAKVNLDREIGEKSFDDIRAEAITIWENRLSRIEVSGKDKEQLKTFYTCMYRAHTFPHKFYEITKDGEIVHFSTSDNTVKPGVAYVDNGFWDTSRTCYTYYSIVCPDDFAEMLSGFVNIYKDSGWLPKWLGPGEIGAMPGTLIDAVIADAAVKGIGSRDVLEDALQGMIKHAEEQPPAPIYGRHGINEYKELGYVPYETHGESVNHTLDYAFGDFCIGQTARALGYDDIAGKYYKRSKNYKNMFDPKTGFMVGRDKDGNFRPDFDEYSWGRDYCEASAWQTSWAVFHDVLGLADLLGGREKMIEKMDKMHTLPPVFKTGGYWSEIHEMAEMAAVDFGQCAICNQPSFHLPYINAALGKQSTAQSVVRRMTSQLFSSGVDGFPGDEDNGSMSCWYILSTLGFYPFCVGSGQYVIGAPLFDKAAVKLPSGRTLTVIAENNEPENLYVSKITLNGKVWDKAYFDHEDIINGGEIVFTLSKTPNDEILPEDKLPLSLKNMTY